MTNSVRMSAREALIEAAFDVLSRDPSAALSQVAERAGVGRATLHRYFPNRDDLVRTLAKVALDEMDRAADDACEGASSYGEALRLMLGALVPLGDRHGFLAREPLGSDKDIDGEFERQQRETENMIDEAKREGVFAKDVPTKWIAQAYDHLLYAAWESVRAGDATPAQASDLAWRTLVNGLKG